MKSVILPGVFGLLLASSMVVQAQRFEISPFGGYRFGGEIEDSVSGAKHSFENGPAYGLMIDYGPADSEMKLEFLWSRQDSSVNFDGSSGVNKVNLSIDEFQFGATAERGKKFREYASGTVGATYFSTDGFGSDTRFSLGLGGGVKYFFLPNLALRLDLHGFCTIVDADSAFIVHNGVTVARFSGSSLWQGQATLGLSLTF